MRSLKYIMAAALLISAFAVTEVSAKRKIVPQVYMFGFSASFTDSVVYITDLQTVDSAWIDTKTKFLLGRENYSYQLRDFFTNKKSIANRTCMIFFGLKKKDAEEKLAKIKRMYTDNPKKKYDVKYLTEADFKFRTVNMDVQEEDEVQKEVKVKEKKKKKPRDKGDRKPGPKEGNR